MKSPIKPNELAREWYVIDAKNAVLGRMTSRIARILQGKHRVYYSPQWDMGDNVIVVNAGLVALTGQKADRKIHYRHTGFPGGIKKMTAGKMREEKPIMLIRQAVKGMLPKSRLGDDMIKKLHIYEGAEHPHEAQKPKELK